MHRNPWLPGTILALAATMAIGACVRPLPTGAPPPDIACSARSEMPWGVEAVRWRFLASGSERAALAPWCAAVGAPVVTSGARTSELPLDSIAVITWNVHGGGGDVARFVWELRAGALTEGRPVEDFVLLLQEAHRASPDLPYPAVGRAPSRVEAAPPGARRADVVTTAREAELALYYVPSMRNGRDAGTKAEDRGNAILSTRPLSSLEALELPFEAQRRVAISAVVRGSAADGSPWRLRIVNAHLDTRSTGSRFWASGGAGRARQSEALASAVDEDIPVVLGGDLNTWSLTIMEGAIDLLRASFPDSPPPLSEPTFRTGWGFARRLDHFFFRLEPGWAARQERVRDRYGSDHHPLLAWVRPASSMSLVARD